MEATETVERIMSRPTTCPGDATVAEAARMMRDEDIGDVVVAEGDRARGIVTDRDLTVRVLAEDRDPSSCTLADICSDDLVTVPTDATLEDVAGLMREHAVRRVVVTEQDRPVGIVSIGDLAMELDDRSALAQISVAPGNR